MKLIALLLLAGACNSGKPGPAKTGTTQPASPQDTVRVKVAGSFTIKLGTTMGTGFRWSLADSLYSDFLKLDSTKVYNDPQGKDNAPDTQVFYFTGIKKGIATLHFIHSRPWQKKDPPDKERIFHVYIE